MDQAKSRAFRLQAQPSDKVLAGLLAIAVGVAAIRLPFVPVLDLLVLHLALLAGFVLAIAVMTR